MFLVITNYLNGNYILVIYKKNIYIYIIYEGFWACLQDIHFI